MNNNSSKKNIKEIVFSLPFFAVLFYLMIIGFIIPLRPTKSVSEKRELEAFPEFSFGSFISGDYFSDISDWFADTFPGRESWLSINRGINSLHGFGTNYIDISRIKPSEEIPVPSTSQNIEAPIEESSPGSNPEDSPETSPAPIEVAAPSPSVTTDEPILNSSISATEFEDLDPDEIDIEMYAGAIQINDTSYAFQGFSKEASDSHTQLINSFADKVAGDGIRFFDVMAPTSIGIILPDEIREKVGSADQGKALSYLYENENLNVGKVNSYDILKEHRNEYIYYHTDHHWSGLGAYYGYVAFCQQAGFSPISLNDYTPLDMGPFRGSFYYSIINMNLIKEDSVTAYVPPGNIDSKIYWSPESSDNFEPSSVIVDKSWDLPSNKYNTYIGGDNPLTVLTNNDLPEAPDCLVIKDSFGNPFAVYLTQHYHNVYVIDYRKYTGSMRDFAIDHGIEDIILCQSIGVSQSTRAGSLLTNLLY